MWGATKQLVSVLRLTLFQSTHPCGVRPLLSLVMQNRRSFNPRTRVGCDFPPSVNKYWRMGFNPRTRVGCDFSGFAPLFVLIVSIHAPVWGATKRCAKLVWFSDVSIHAPVWGATPLVAALVTVPFQSTHPCGVRPRRRGSAGRWRVSIHAPVWGATQRRPR